MTISELRDLRKAANQALEEIQKNRTDGPINWEDLSCTEASWVQSDSGVAYPQVTIEEADPGAEELQREIRLRLANAGHLGVIVITEW